MTTIFKEVALLWKDQKRQYVRPSTYSTYTQLCNSLILPAFGVGPLPDEAAVQSFITDLLNRGFAVKTVKDTVLVLNMIICLGEKLAPWSPGHTGTISTAFSASSGCPKRASTRSGTVLPHDASSPNATTRPSPPSLATHPLPPP